MLTAMSLKPLGLSSLYGLWLVLFSRLPSCFPEDLASPACLALQEKHLALLLLNWNLKYSNAQTLLQKSGDFLFSEMKGLSHSWPVEASKQVSKADRSWHLRSQFFFRLLCGRNVGCWLVLLVIKRTCLLASFLVCMCSTLAIAS